MKQKTLIDNIRILPDGPIPLLLLCTEEEVNHICTLYQIKSVCKQFQLGFGTRLLHITQRIALGDLAWKIKLGLMSEKVYFVGLYEY